MSIVEQGQTVTLELLTEESDGEVVDYTDVTVSIINALGATVVSLDTPTHASTGHYSYAYVVAADAPTGAWTVRWFGKLDGDEIGPVDESFTVVRQGALAEPVAGGLTCTPWATSDDAPLSLMQYDVDPGDVDVAYQIASDILYEITGRRWPGICSDTIRPTASWSASVPPGRWLPSIVGASGPWGWCSCNRSHDVGCATIPQIKLPGNPVVVDSIVVRVDGELLTADQFRLDDHRYLVRVDGHSWPCCQNMRLDDTEERTWSVTYSYGSLPDIGGRRMAVLLGTSLYGELFPEEATRCKIPERARTVTRQGTTYDLDTFDAMMEHGATGIRAVDLWIASKNLGRQRRPATVVIPGISRLGRRVGA